MNKKENCKTRVFSNSYYTSGIGTIAAVDAMGSILFGFIKSMVSNIKFNFTVIKK